MTLKTVKKYSNRRLYDTDLSQYITLDELAVAIRQGHDVRVVDARTDEDLTQSVLAQIILESRGAGRLLPVPLLLQLIRMGDDALAEFMTQYIAWAMEVYVHLKQSVRGVRQYSPLAALRPGEEAGGGNVLARWLAAQDWQGPWSQYRPAAVNPGSLARVLEELAHQLGHWRASGGPMSGADDVAPIEMPTAGPPGSAEAHDVAMLRREISELRARLNQVAPVAPEATGPVAAPRRATAGKKG